MGFSTQDRQRAMSSRCEITGGGETEKEQRLFLGALGVTVQRARVAGKALCSGGKGKRLYEKEGRGDSMMQIKKIRGKGANLSLTSGAILVTMALLPLSN